MGRGGFRGGRGGFRPRGTEGIVALAAGFRGGRLRFTERTMQRNRERDENFRNRLKNRRGGYRGRQDVERGGGLHPRRRPPVGHREQRAR